MYIVCYFYVSLSDIVRNLLSVSPDWDVYGKIIASKYRQWVICSLQEHPKTPTQISEEINKHQSHVSKTLTELQKLDIARCLNQNAKKGRLYELTEQGEKIYTRLKKEGYFENE